MSSILLEPILPNLTKVSGSREQLRDLWRLFTKVKDCTQGGRRLENLYWRLWYQSTSTGNDQEAAKISSLLETWSHDSPTFKASSKLPSGASLIEDHCLIPEAPAPVRREESREKLAELAGAPKDLAVASSVASVASVASVSSNLPLPTPTPSIAISRVGPSLRNLASAAANFEAPRVAPAHKKIPTGGKPAAATPPKVSVGFNSPQKPSSALSEAAGAASPKPLAEVVRASAPQFSAAPTPVSASAAASTASTSPSSAIFTRSNLPPAEQATPERSKPRKKFFITSSDSDDSSSELEDSYERPSRLPPKPTLTAAAAPSDPLTCTSAAAQSAAIDPNAIFCKVDPEGPDPKVSRLSSLLKSPRRTVPVRPSHLLSNNRTFFNPNHSRSDDFFLSGQGESESLRRGLQLDRKPLFDISMGLSASVTSFATTPNVW